MPDLQPDLQHPPQKVTLHTCQHADRFGSLHPCGKAHAALREAGVDYDDNVLDSGRPFGIGTGGKRPELKRISGQEKLPVLALPDGTTISGSGDIVAWARAQAPVAG